MYLIFFSGHITNPAIWWVLGAVRIFQSLPRGTVTLTWVAESSVPLLPFSLWRRANARNVSFLTLYGGQFTLSTQLIIQNYRVILSHRRSTTVSLETYPFIQVKSDEVRILECRSSVAPHEALHEGFTWASRRDAVQAKTLQAAFSAENHTEEVVVINTTDYRYFAILINVLASNNTYSLSYVYRKKPF